MAATTASDTLSVRVNGVLPDVDGAGANTSISLFYGGFHLLVDAGNGVAASVKKGAADLGYKENPDAVLVTHARRQHVADLSSFAGVPVYCTSECAGQLPKEVKVTAVTPGQPFTIGPFSVTPVAADNAGDSPGYPGSVIYVIAASGKKVVAGWDFMKLAGADPNLFWNPDLAVLGTETYNIHPSTGMISVTEAYDLVRRWNAKDTYIVHYSGEKDREDARNQWHRGPGKPLPPDELQKAIDGHLRVMGQEGKFRVTVAKEGMVWRPATEGAVVDEGPIGKRIEIEALEKHVFALEKMPDGKLSFSVEDSINRLTQEFVNPRREGDRSLRTDAIKSMMMKGPELHLVISGTTVKVEIIKGKKPMFAADMPVSERDAKRLARYITENF
jgi:L-ascorbate metabolism protein UlaG (beta-lactamase superfamily)